MQQTDLFSRLSGGEILGFFGISLGILAIAAVSIVAIVKVITAHYRRTQLDEMEATLKMEMIQRGMSAGDIKQVLEARMSASSAPSLQERLGSWSTFWMSGANCSHRAKKANALTE